MRPLQWRQRCQLLRLQQIPVRAVSKPAHHSERPLWNPRNRHLNCSRCRDSCQDHSEHWLLPKRFPPRMQRQTWPPLLQSTPQAPQGASWIKRARRSRLRHATQRIRPQLLQPKTTTTATEHTTATEGFNRAGNPQLKKFLLRRAKHTSSSSSSSYAMVWQIAEPEYKAKRISDWRLRGPGRNNWPAISGLHPTAHKRHGHEQRSAVALKLLFGYLNCRPSNIVVKYSTERVGDSLLGTKGGGGNCWKDPNFDIYFCLCFERHCFIVRL